MTDTLDITMRLRQHQEQDPILGALFAALHTFADRTIERFYEDTPDLPYPVVAMEKDRRTRLGYYTQRDGYTLVHRINLNPYALRTGEEAAETLAHEIVHLWQEHIGKPCQRNYHGAEFHRRMATYGIETKGKKGAHVGYVEGDPTWPNWMVENEDLQLDKFVLPGADAKPTRKLLKLQCPDCGMSVRNRQPVRLMCLECTEELEVVSPGRSRV